MVGVAGLLLGGYRCVLSKTLVTILTGVFDPPPDRLAVPWPYLAAVTALGVACLAAAERRPRWRPGAAGDGTARL